MDQWIVWPRFPISSRCQRQIFQENQGRGGTSQWSKFYARQKDFCKTLIKKKLNLLLTEVGGVFCEQGISMKK